MEEEKKKLIALFRFGVIAGLIGYAKLDQGKREARIKELAQQEWEIPCSGRSSISRSTIRDWLRRYEHSGKKLESLFPKDRADAGVGRSIDPETELALVNLRRELAQVSLSVVLQVARRRNLLPPGFAASRQSIYRLFRRHGLHRQRPAAQDRRRFEAELPNDLWQADCMHGPRVKSDGKLRKSFLFACIDDHSRLITGARFYLRENIDCFQDCLLRALETRGLPRKLYVDNGPSFRSQRLSYACASLGIALIFATPYTPQGKGKIERCFRTIRTQMLPLVGAHDSLDQLNAQLAEWLDHSYHQRVHSSTGERPLQRYLRHLELLRPAPQELRDHFRTVVRRKVDKDRAVALYGKLYEAPVGLIGNTVNLLYHEADPSRIEVFFEDRSYGFLSELNPHVNSRVRRVSGHETELDPAPEPPADDPQPGPRGGQLFEESDR